MLTILVSGIIKQSLAGFSVELMIPHGGMIDLQAFLSVRHIGPPPHGGMVDLQAFPSVRHIGPPPCVVSATSVWV